MKSNSEEPKSFKLDFRCPAESYRPLQIILSQGLDPRVQTMSDICNIAISMYPESVEKYITRPLVREAMQMRKALQEAEFKKSVVDMRFKLANLGHEVGNGQYKAAIEGAENDVRLFLPEGY